MAKEKLKTCAGCPALCCRYISLEIDKPTTKKDWDNILWYLYHENVIIYVDQENDWMIEFQTKCKNLGTDNKCMIYSTRPQICRDFKAEDCEFHNEGSPYKLIFKNSEELTQYLEKNKIDYQLKYKN